MDLAWESILKVVEGLNIEYKNYDFGLSINGDSLEIIKHFPDGTIDMILTDPPYAISREVKIHRAGNYKYKGKDIDLYFGDWDKQWQNVDEYLNWCYAWVKDSGRILRKGGHMVFFFDKFKISYIIDFAEQNGFKARQCLFWLKSNPTPRARKINFMEALEMAVWLTKETTSREFATFNYQLGQSPNYFITSLPINQKEEGGQRLHPTQKPLKWALWVLSYLTNEGDIVLDLFGGSGTFAVAALNLNRKFIIIEKEKKYYQTINKRIEKIIKQLDLFKTHLVEGQ